MFQDMVVRAGDLIAGVLDRLDPDAVSGSGARELWSSFDRAERLAAAGKTLLARRIAAAHQPGKAGSKTAAEELARKAGSSAGAAKEAMDTSERLPGQPELDKSLRRGELSPAQAGLISSAAAANLAEERRLIELASRVSLAELREECARVRAAADPDPEATNRRLHAGRRLRRWTDREGFWNLHANGTPQAGAAFNAVLDPIIDRIFNTAQAHGRREHPDAYAFDALMHLAEHAAGHCDCQVDPAGAEAPGADGGGTDVGADADARFSGAATRGAATPTGERAADSAGRTDPRTPGTNRSASAGVPSGGADSDDRPGSALIAGDPGIFAAPASSVGRAGSGCAVRRPQSVNPRYLALLRVDAAALRRGHVQGEELCEIAGVGPVPVSVAKEVLGEAIVKLVITNGVDVVNVTHLGRGPTMAQKIALLWTNPLCSVEGCDRRRIEYDHQKPWAQTRHTRLDELDPLCGFHHDLKTRLHWALVPGTGKRAFVAPDDPRHPRYRTTPADRPRAGGDVAPRPRRPAATAEDARSPTVPGPAAPPGKASPPRTVRRVAAAQMTLPEPPAEQAPQPP